MPNRYAAALLAALIGVAAPAIAGERGDWYLAGGLVAGFAELDGFETSGPVGNGQTFNGVLDGTLTRTGNEDVVAALRFAAGKRFDAWRLEGEYVYRYRTDLDTTAVTFSRNAPTQFHNNIETHVLLANVKREFSPWRRMVPWVSAGIGWVRNNSDAELIFRSDGTTPESTISDEADTSDFTWTVGAGISVPFGKRWAFELSYRYLPLGDIESGPYGNTGIGLDADDHDSHDILLGFRYDFDR